MKRYANLKIASEISVTLIARIYTTEFYEVNLCLFSLRNVFAYIFLYGATIQN